MNDEERLISIIENNVNVGKRNDGHEFLILISGFVVLCLLIFVFADICANIFINKMSIKTQIKIEDTIFGSDYKFIYNKPSERTQKLELIKKKIIALDKNLQYRSDFKIKEIKDKDINAFVTPNGEIFFTSGLLDEIDDEEALTFVLAHELGHYVHRDHLKSMSREIVSSLIIHCITFGQKELSITTSSLSSMSGMSYSRKQEKNADAYGNMVVKKIYGTNEGAIRFFEYLQSKENYPEFLNYFSTHPSTKERIKQLKK